VGWGNAKFEVCGTSLRHGCKRPRWPEGSVVCGTSTPDELNFHLQAPKNQPVLWLNVTTSSSLMKLKIRKQPSLYCKAGNQDIQYLYHPLNQQVHWFEQ
jgi:hypothetical protein